MASLITRTLFTARESDVHPPAKCREVFDESWLVEMPQRNIVGWELYPTLKRSLSEWQTYYQSELVNQTTSKCVGNSTLYYWTHEPGDSTTANVIIELAKTAYNLTVTAVAKAPGTTTQVADLYSAIVSDNKSTSLRLVSDEKMSIGGLHIWKQLLKKHKLSYYKLGARVDQQELYPIADEAQLVSLFGDTPEFKKYQFVLSENARTQFETHHFFKTRVMQNTLYSDVSQ